MNSLKTSAALEPGICVTRALKNARYLQQVAPDLMPAIEPPAGLGSIIPYEVLSRLHRPGAASELHNHPRLQKTLQNIEFPGVSNAVTGPLFQGYLYFVRLQFEIFPVREPRIARTTSAIQPYPLISVSLADMGTAIEYASLASIWISDYARQYGPNRVIVHQKTIDYSIALQGTNSYNKSQLETWINAIAQNLPSSACVVILNPMGVTNVDADLSQGFAGYHDVANVPYVFVNMRGTNITLADRAYHYAAPLSHEIAEMVVDPQANQSNPEVCDPCDQTCPGQHAYLDYFTYDAYITSEQAFPPTFPYTFFTAAIVNPSKAGTCMAGPSDCAYAPPFCIPPEIVLILEELLRLTGGNPPPTSVLSPSEARLATVRAITGLAQSLRDPTAQKAIEAALRPIAARLEQLLKERVVAQ